MSSSKPLLPLIPFISPGLSLSTKPTPPPTSTSQYLTILITRTRTDEGYLVYFKNKWLFFYNEAFGNSINYRVATSFEGPWSEGIVLYEVPDEYKSRNRFFYAPKVHPEMSRHDDELILTYATNSFVPEDLDDDADLYVPRFIRSFW
ncbi:hypothetical protein GEMRC1_005398 [Eukaryota sp. GEM-RC1]